MLHRAPIGEKEKKKKLQKLKDFANFFLLAAPIHFLYQHYDKIRTQPFNLLSKYKGKEIFSNWPLETKNIYHHGLR
jgi:hypothetical protein